MHELQDRDAGTVLMRPEQQHLAAGDQYAPELLQRLDDLLFLEMLHDTQVVDAGVGVFA